MNKQQELLERLQTYLENTPCGAIMDERIELLVLAFKEITRQDGVIERLRAEIKGHNDHMDELYEHAGYSLEAGRYTEFDDKYKRDERELGQPCLPLPPLTGEDR